jgi:ribose-phosphate pyrophosphokinase
MSTPRINVFNETMTQKIFTSGDALDFMTFPAGEPFVKLQTMNSDIRGRKVVVDARIRSFNDIAHLIGTVELLRHNGALLDTLLIPYFPGSRGDRDVPFHAKMYADQFKALGFRRIVTLDPHSQVCVALSGATEMYWTPNIGGKYSHIIVPDAGAAARSDMWQRQLKIPNRVQVFKHRDMSTGQLSGFDVPQLGDQLRHTGIICDDICDGGYTFNAGAEAVREKFPQMALDLFVSHGLFSKGTDQLLKTFGKIYSSTSMHSAQTLKDMGVIPLPVHPNEGEI